MSQTFQAICTYYPQGQEDFIGTVFPGASDQNANQHAQNEANAHMAAKPGHRAIVDIQYINDGL